MYKMYTCIYYSVLNKSYCVKQKYTYSSFCIDHIYLDLKYKMIALHEFKLTCAPCYNEFNVRRFVFYDVKNQNYFYTMTNGLQAFYDISKDRIAMDISYAYYIKYYPRWITMYLIMTKLLGEVGKDIFNIIASYYIYL